MTRYRILPLVVLLVGAALFVFIAFGTNARADDNSLHKQVDDLIKALAGVDPNDAQVAAELARLRSAVKTPGCNVVNSVDCQIEALKLGAQKLQPTLAGEQIESTKIILDSILASWGANWEEEATYLSAALKRPLAANKDDFKTLLPIINLVAEMRTIEKANGAIDNTLSTNLWSAIERLVKLDDNRRSERIKQLAGLLASSLATNPASTFDFTLFDALGKVNVAAADKVRADKDKLKNTISMGDLTSIRTFFGSTWNLADSLGGLSNTLPVDNVVGLSTVVKTSLATPQVTLNSGPDPANTALRNAIGPAIDALQKIEIGDATYAASKRATALSAALKASPNVSDPSLAAALKDLDQNLKSLNVPSGPAINVIAAWFGDIRSILAKSERQWEEDATAGDARTCLATRAVSSLCQGKGICFAPTTGNGNGAASVPAAITGEWLCGFDPVPYASPQAKGLVVEYECLQRTKREWDRSAGVFPRRPQPGKAPFKALLRGSGAAAINCVSP